MFKFTSHTFLTTKGQGRQRQHLVPVCVSFQSLQPTFPSFLPFSYSAPWLLLPERVGRGYQGKEESSSTFHFHLWQLVLEVTHKNHANLASVTPPPPCRFRNKEMRFRGGKWLPQVTLLWRSRAGIWTQIFTATKWKIFTLQHTHKWDTVSSHLFWKFWPKVCVCVKDVQKLNCWSNCFDLPSIKIFHSVCHYHGLLRICTV